MPASPLRSMKNKPLCDLLDIIGYEPEDITHIKTALTHSSYANTSGNGVMKNEKYEFLGDSILGFVTAEYIFLRFIDLSEGELTRLRSSIVCEQNLSACAKKIGLGRYILFGKGEELSGGHEKPSILADALEAVIGAIYLDKGIVTAKEFIEKHILVPYFLINEISDKKDYKSLLQEIIQQNRKAKIRYETSGSEGPDHDKTFHIDLYIDDRLSASGSGKSKKEAEQTAAQIAYKKKKEGN
jgi:ribonuclease III